MGQGKSDGGSGQARPVLLADVGDLVDAGDHPRWRSLIVVCGARSGSRPGEDSGVEDADGHDALALCCSRDQRVIECILLQEGVAAGQHDDVDRGFPQEPGKHRRLVHPDANCPDDALRAQVCQRRYRLGCRLPPVVVRVVHVHHVEPVQAGTGQRGVDGSQYAVPAVIPLPAQLVRHGESLAVATGRVRVRNE